jgi:hypothetical protein
MRRFLLLLPLALSCGRDSGGPSHDQEPAGTYQVSGTVVDSLFGLGLRGVRVRIGDSVVLTDSTGRFSTLHRPGNITLAIDHIGYERYEIPLDPYQRSTALRVPLQGQAPYLLSCLFDADLLTARILDLQGRKTLNRRSQSTITLVSDAATVTRDAYSWYFTAVDNLTWLAHVPLAGMVADTARWRLEDADGYVRTAQCVKQPPTCTTC